MEDQASGRDRPAEAARIGDRFGLAVGLVTLMALALSTAWLEGASLPFNPQNGHFQNFNMSARLLAGQFPFADFPAYLGLGPLLLPFPIFAALGGTVSASNAAFAFVSVLTLGISFVMLLRLCGMGRAMAWPLASLLAVFPWAMARAAESAIGIRSFLPFVAAGILVVAARLVAEGRWSRARANATVGAGCGAALLWSNDYGLTTALSLAVAGGIVLAPAGWRASARCLLIMAASAAASFLCIATAATGGEPGAWIAFNFGGVAGDQFWYFNPAASTKVYSLSDLPADAGSLLMAATCLGLAVRWLAFRRRDPAAAGLAVIAGATLGAVLVSGLAGTFEPRYFSPLIRVALVCGPFLSLLALGHALRRFVLARRRDAAPFPASAIRSFAVGVVGLHAAGLSLFLFWGSAVGTVWHLPGERDFAAPELGASVPPSYSSAVELARSLRRAYDAEGLPPDRRLLSTYATAVSEIAGSRQTVPDYVIHALGDEARARFEEAVAGTGYRNVETMDPDLLLWGTWNVRTSWPVYRALFRHWIPAARTPWSIVWQRRTTPMDMGADVSCAVAGSRADRRVAVTISPGAAGSLAESWWAEVELDVEAELTPSGLPLIGSRGILELTENPPPSDHRFDHRSGYDELTGLVSNTWTRNLEGGRLRIPVRMWPGRDTTLALRAWPEGRSAVSVKACAARLVAPLSATTLPWDGPRGGVAALAQPTVPTAAPYHGSGSEPPPASGMAIYFKTRDQIFPARVLPGDEVEFPDGTRARVLLRDFRQIVVEWREDMAFQEPLSSIRIVPVQGR